jgi:hypothetical protein
VLTLRRAAGGTELAAADTEQSVDGPGPPACVAVRPEDRPLIIRWTLAGTIVGFIPFVLTLWDFGIRPLRTAGAHRFASNVYDLQARAFLDGDLALPRSSLGIEGFVVDGRTYMYFPPFPALLRVPVLMLTDRFDGRLTAMSMLLAWIVLAAATAALFWNVRLLLRPASPLRRIDGFAAAVLISAVTGGSVIVFDAALPWVYHEVYVWAAAFAVGTLYGLVAMAREPGPRVTALTCLCVIGAILTRTTTGWALAGAVLVAGIIALCRRDRRNRYGFGLVVGGVVALAAGVAFNWAKFRHPFMFPLEHQEWTRVNARRRLALLMNGGSITGPQFVRSSLINYFRPDGIRVVSYFPFVTLPAAPARGYGGAFVDQAYRTGSVPAFMPLLFLASLWGIVATMLVRPWRRLIDLVVPLVGALLICAGVMGYGYFAHRYTSEFLPALVIGAAIGIVDIARRLERPSVWARRGVAMFAASLVAFGMLANTAVGLATARLTWRGERLADYVATQHSVGSILGGALRPRVTWSPALPQVAPTDTLHIVGDCEALYIATGDQYEPWVLVEARTLATDITVGSDGTSEGIARLFAFEGARRRNVTLETSDNDRMRLRIGEGWIYLATEWDRVRPGETITLTVTADTERDRFRVSIPGHPDEFVNAAEWSRRWVNVPSTAAHAVPPVEFVEPLGVTIEERRGPPPKLCVKLLADLRR